MYCIQYVQYVQYELNWRTPSPCSLWSLVKSRKSKWTLLPFLQLADSFSSPYPLTVMSWVMAWDIAGQIWMDSSVSIKIQSWAYRPHAHASVTIRVTTFVCRTKGSLLLWYCVRIDPCIPFRAFSHTFISPRIWFLGGMGLVTNFRLKRHFKPVHPFCACLAAFCSRFIRAQAIVIGQTYRQLDERAHDCRYRFIRPHGGLLLFVPLDT